MKKDKAKEVLGNLSAEIKENFEICKKFYFNECNGGTMKNNKIKPFSTKEKIIISNMIKTGIHFIITYFDVYKDELEEDYAHRKTNYKTIQDLSIIKRVFQGKSLAIKSLDILGKEDADITFMNNLQSNLWLYFYNKKEYYANLYKNPYKISHEDLNDIFFVLLADFYLFDLFEKIEVIIEEELGPEIDDDLL